MEVVCLKKKKKKKKKKWNAYWFTGFRHVTCTSYTIKNVTISEISLRKFWILRRFNVKQMPFFQLVGSGVCCSPTNTICNIIAF